MYEVYYSASSCTWDNVMKEPNTGEDHRNSPVEGALETSRWTWGNSVLLQQWRQIRSWAASEGAMLASIEVWSSHSTLRLLGHVWNTVPGSGPHNSKKDMRVQRKAMKMIKRMENLFCDEWLKKSSLFSLEKRRLRGSLSWHSIYLKGGN